MLRSPRRQSEPIPHSGNSKRLEAQPPHGGAANSNALIARSELNESLPEWDDLVNIGDAARELDLSFEEVSELCEAGALQAQRTRNGFWLIDHHSLTQWREANPAKEAMQSPCPPGMCEGHWERRGELIPEFRAGLCQRCHSGRPLPMRVDL